MTTEYNVAIDKLLVYLPKFEAGEEITYENWFMSFYRLALDEFCDQHYPDNIEGMGWGCLTDMDYISRASIAQLKTILTAICRSERYAMYSEPWERYVEAGSFTAILRRLAAIQNAK